MSMADFSMGEQREDVVEIELVGGPQDGAIIAVPRTGKPETDPTCLSSDRLGEYGGLPVLRRPDGRLFVMWPRQQKEAA